MDKLISVGFMAGVAALICFALFKLGKAFLRYSILHNKAMALLSESKSLESLSTKQERLQASVSWKQKRDSLLFKAESLNNELNEIEDYL